jgi:hypothetical protein
MGSRTAHFSRRRRPRSRPDLAGILYRLGRAQALISVAHRSLEAREVAGAGEEGLALETGLAALNAVYDDLDRAAMEIRKGA